MTRSTLRRAQGRPEDDRGATKLRVRVRLWFDGLTTPRKIEGRLTRSLVREIEP